MVDIGCWVVYNVFSEGETMAREIVAEWPGCVKLTEDEAWAHAISYWRGEKLQELKAKVACRFWDILDAVDKDFGLQANRDSIRAKISHLAS